MQVKAGVRRAQSSRSGLSMTDKKQAFRAFLRSLASTLGWVIVGAVAALLVPSIPWLRRFPAIEVGLVGAGAAVVGLTGLWRAWHCMWAYDFYSRGYRVRRIARHEFVYEEFGDDEMLRSLGFGYVRRVEGYAPPHRISLPGEQEWSVATPVWAHDRRIDIVDRLTRWAQGGKDPDPRVTLVPPGSLEAV